MSEDRLTCVVVEVATSEAELAADALWGAGATAVGEEHVGATTRLTASFADASTTSAAAAAVGGSVVVVDATPAVGRTGVVEIGALRLAVLAGDGDPAPAGADVVVVPGTAFGDGHHPSTRLALRALVDLVRPPCRVLDVGCGSGVLSVVAARLGAETVAVDVDPDAVATTRANADRNRLSVAATTAAVADVEGAFDVVVANLGGARVVHDLGAALAARTAPDGRLVVSGLLADRLPPPSVALPGLVVVGVAEEDGWAAMTLRRR